MILKRLIRMALIAAVTALGARLARRRHKPAPEGSWQDATPEPSSEPPAPTSPEATDSP